MYGYDDWGQLPMTLTKEISRIIRWGIGEYGGKILFEGADVYYSQVFGVGEKLADTDLEARILLGFFDKKSIQEGKFTACIGNPDPKSADKGKGEVEFYWHGKPTAPSKLLFLTSWTWQKNSRSHELIQPESFGEPLESLKDKVRYNSNFTPQKYGNITRERNNFFTGSYQFNYTSGDTIFQAINNYNPIAHIETNQKLFLQVWEDIWENRIPTFPPGLPSFPDRKKDIYNIAEWLQNLKNPPTDDLYERVIVNGKTTWQLKGDRLVDPLDPNRNELEEYGKWSEYAPHTAKSDYLVEIFPKYAQEALLKYDQQIKGFFTRQSAESRAASRVLKESLKYDTNPVNFLNLVCWLIGEEATPVNVMIKKGLSRPLKKDSRLCGLLKEAHHNWQIYVKANQYNAKKLKSENHKEMYLNWTLKKIET